MRSHIAITNKERDLDTKVSEKAQKEYEKKCKELGLKYKKISDEPEHYNGIKEKK